MSTTSSSIALEDISPSKITARVALSPKYKISDYDFVAVAVKGCAKDDYVTYAYNADKTREGVIAICREKSTLKTSQTYTLRYYDRGSKIVCESPPFPAPSSSSCPSSSSTTSTKQRSKTKTSSSPFAKVAFQSEASGKIRCGISVSGHTPSDYDYVSICDAGSAKSDYLAFAYNSESTSSGTVTIDYDLNDDDAYVLRYVAASGRVLGESPSFRKGSAAAAVVRTTQYSNASTGIASVKPKSSSVRAVAKASATRRTPTTTTTTRTVRSNADSVSVRAPSTATTSKASTSLTREARLNTRATTTASSTESSVLTGIALVVRGKSRPRWKESGSKGTSRLVGLYSLKRQGADSGAKTKTMHEWRVGGPCGKQYVTGSGFGGGSSGISNGFNHGLTPKKLWAQFFDKAYWAQEKWKTCSKFKKAWTMENPDRPLPRSIDYSIEGVPCDGFECAIRAKLGPCPGTGGGFFARMKIGQAKVHRCLENNLALAHRHYWRVDTAAGPPQREIANFASGGGGGAKRPWEIKNARGAITPHFCKRCSQKPQNTDRCAKCNARDTSYEAVACGSACNEYRRGKCFGCGSRISNLDCEPVNHCEPVMVCRSMSCGQDRKCVKCGRTAM